MQFECLLKEALKDDEVVDLASDAQSLKLEIGNILGEQRLTTGISNHGSVTEMKCNDVRTFFSQIAEKSVSMQIQPSDMDFLFNSGYLSAMQKEDYDRALAEVSNLTQMNVDLVNAENVERNAKIALEEGGEENSFNHLSF